MNGRETEQRHTVTIENRKRLTVTGVTDTDSFDEKNVLLYTCMGELLIRGKNLKVSGLSTDTGEMTVEGEIFSVTYGDKNVTSPLSIFGKFAK